MLLSKHTCSTVADVQTAMAGSKTESRDTPAMGFSKAVSVNRTVRLQSFPGLARLIYTTEESLGVCEHCL